MFCNEQVKLLHNIINLIYDLNMQCDMFFAFYLKNWSAILLHMQEEKWKEQEPEERKLDFIPKRYSSLRLVPSYASYVQEWFNRCLDLYLCPRQRKMRVTYFLLELFNYLIYSVYISFYQKC